MWYVETHDQAFIPNLEVGQTLMCCEQVELYKQFGAFDVLPDRIRPSGNRSLRARPVNGSAAFDIWILIAPPIDMGDVRNSTYTDPISVKETKPLPPQSLTVPSCFPLASVFAGKLREEKVKLDKQKARGVQGNFDPKTSQQAHSSVTKDNAHASHSKGFSLSFSVAKGIVRFENESAGCVSPDRKKMEDIVFAQVEKEKGRIGKPFEGHGHITLEHRPHYTQPYHFIQLHSKPTILETRQFDKDAGIITSRAVTTQPPTYIPPPRRQTKSRGTQSEEAAAKEQERINNFMHRLKLIREGHFDTQAPKALSEKVKNKKPGVTRDVDLIKRTVEAGCGPHNQPTQRDFGQQVEKLLLDAGQRAISTYVAKCPGATLQDIKADAHKMVELAAEELGQEPGSKGSKTSESIPPGSAAKSGLFEYEAMKDEDWEMISQA